MYILKIIINVHVWLILEYWLRMAVSASLNDCDHLFLTENTPIVLGTARIDFVRDALAMLQFWKYDSLLS